MVSLFKPILQVGGDTVKPGIRRESLQSEIIKYIKEYIQEKDLKEGDKLPSQADLVNMLGVSRTSLREAIKTLEAKNIVEAVNGKGVFIKNTEEKHLLSQIEFSKEKESIVELLEARKLIEREILGLVVKNITDDEVQELGHVVDVLMRKYRNEEPQEKEDKQFHYMIYSFSHNRIMVEFMKSISSVMDKLWESPLDMEKPFTNTIPMHDDLFQAIKARNAKDAVRVNDKIILQMIKDVNKQ